MLSGCTVLPDSKDTKLGSSNQEASPSAGKNSGIVLVPWHAWKCVPTTFRWCEYFQCPWMSFVMTGILSEGHKITLSIGI